MPTALIAGYRYISIADIVLIVQDSSFIFPRLPSVPCDLQWGRNPGYVDNRLLDASYIKWCFGNAQTIIILSEGMTDSSRLSNAIHAFPSNT
jgi:hypothetical protein